MIETLVILILAILILLLLHRRGSNQDDSSGSRQKKLIRSILRLNLFLYIMPLLPAWLGEWDETQFLMSVLYLFVGFNAFSYSYFHLFNMSETGRRIRLLQEIRIGNIKTAKDIQSIYLSKNMIKERLSRLQELHQVEQNTSGEYLLTGRLLVSIAVVFRRIRSIVLGRNMI